MSLVPGTQAPFPIEMSPGTREAAIRHGLTFVAIAAPDAVAVVRAIGPEPDGLCSGLHPTIDAAAADWVSQHVPTFAGLGHHVVGQPSTRLRETDPPEHLHPHGGYLPARPEGHVVRLAEGGQAEYIAAPCDQPDGAA